MFVIKFRRLFPESDWCLWRGSYGVLTFRTREDAEDYASSLRLNRKYFGYQIVVDSD